jgi:hypothetical protein
VELVDLLGRLMSELTEYQKGFIAGMRTYQLFIDDAQIILENNSDDAANWWEMQGPDVDTSSDH